MDGPFGIIAQSLLTWSEEPRAKRKEPGRPVFVVNTRLADYDDFDLEEDLHLGFDPTATDMPGKELDPTPADPVPS